MILTIYLFGLNQIVLIITCVLGAMFAIPTIPISINFANESTYPLDEPTVIGFMYMLAYGLGFI
jgi:maltodextrin utilization protein YvdJ